jgi:hypothetical protein
LFDLREAVPKGHPTNSRKLQEILDGSGLKDLRSEVASRSRIPRVDAERHYEPDFETASFEEMNAEARELALKAALWLIDRWPDRFLRCCKEARAC